MQSVNRDKKTKKVLSYYIKKLRNIKKGEKFALLFGKLWLLFKVNQIMRAYIIFVKIKKDKAKENYWWAQKKEENMHNSKERLITLITTIMIALIAIPLLCFGLGSNKGVQTSWLISPHKNNVTGEYYNDSVIYSLSGSATGAYIYVGNVYNAPDGKIEIVIVTSDSLESIKGGDYFPPSKKVCSFETVNGSYNGWIKLNFSGTLSAKYVKLSSKQSFEFFEVGFTTSKGKVVNAECVGGIVWKDGNHKFVSATKEKGTFANTCDEQGAFNPFKNINTLSQKEIQLSGAVDNLINFKGGYVSKNANPLGVAITSIGVLAFGNGPFGLRIMGFLFFIATLYLLFFFAKKLFNSAISGVIALLLYVLAGIGISIVTTSGIESITTFFLLASFYFAANYYIKAKDGKSARVNSNNLIVCGLTYSLAVSVSIYAIFALPALLFICLYPGIKAIIQTRKTFVTSSGLEKEYAREKYNRTTSLVVIKSILGFIVMPIILVVIAYGIAFPTYTSYYGKNLFASIFENHKMAFSLFGDGFFLTWVLGLGHSAMATPFGFNVYVIANRALTLIACVSVAIIGVLYILERSGKISNGHLIVALKDYKQVYSIVLAGFLSTWLMNIFVLNNANYASFAITLIFAVISLTLLHKMLTVSARKWVRNLITATALTLIVFCLVLELPYLFNFDLPKDFQAIYNWLV